MDSSKYGVIYVSFGTNVLPSVLPPEKIQIMTKVLSQLPYDVLWKWDDSTLPGQSKNIKTATWFPQTDVLSKLNFNLLLQCLNIVLRLSQSKYRQVHIYHYVTV